MKRTRSYAPNTVAATQLLGVEIAQARRARRWTVTELAERAGISVITLRNAERGVPTVAIGTMFELATLVGIALFGVDASQLPALLERGRDRLAVLPARVREPAGPVHDDF
jgi:transcriptional regulator with XRE-family HTH domain